MPQWPNRGGGGGGGGGLERVHGGGHDSYTLQCGLLGYFTSPDIDTR